MRSKFLFVFLLVFSLFLFGCSQEGDIYVKKVSTQTVNNTFFDASRSFDMQSFASSCSFSVSSNVSNLSCSSGDVSFLWVNKSSGVWTLSCCVFLSNKCYWYNSSNITKFNESKQYLDSVLGSKFEKGSYGSMCCNNQMSQCFWQKPSLNGSFQVCGMEYDQILVSSRFNLSSGVWRLVTCVDGFK